MVWRKEKTAPGRTTTAPPGYRDGGRPLFADNEVVSSTYQVRSMLGSSDTGQVFEARDMLLERMVALQGAWRDEGVPPLVRDARMLGAIAHPCVATVYGMGHHHGIQFMAAERIGGLSLSTYIEHAYGSSSLPLLEGIELLRSLTRGLMAVHDAGYGVPSLSTKNLLLAPGPRLVMSRFALGQGQLQAASPVLAPESITGAARPEPGTRPGVAMDLYALGCVAAELLTGKPPFVGETFKALTFAHVRQRPAQLGSLRGDVPTELDDLVLELLAKQPDARPESAREVHTQLEAIRERVIATRAPLPVLIVDDEPTRVRTLWSLVRRAHGSAVVEAVLDAEKAVAAFRRDRPRVLLLNMQLPGSMTGFELLMYLQGLEAEQSCVIVALTSEVKDSDVQLLSQLGVAQVLPLGAGSHADIAALLRRLGAAGSPPK